MSNAIFQDTTPVANSYETSTFQPNLTQKTSTKGMAKCKLQPGSLQEVSWKLLVSHPQTKIKKLKYKFKKSIIFYLTFVFYYYIF